MEDFLKLVDEAAEDYEEYRAEYEALRNKKKKEEEERQKADIDKISEDLKKEGLCFVRKAIRSVRTRVLLPHFKLSLCRLQGVRMKLCTSNANLGLSYTFY